MIPIECREDLAATILAREAPLHAFPRTVAGDVEHLWEHQGNFPGSLIEPGRSFQECSEA
jgi:hypothetical protein